MIIFIYGEDTFRSRKKLKELKDKFIREIDPAESSLTTLDGKTAKAKEIIDCFGARSLLAKKRMTVIENLFFNKNRVAFEEIFNYLKKVHPIRNSGGTFPPEADRPLAENSAKIISKSQPARPAKGEAPPVGGPREAGQPLADNPEAKQWGVISNGARTGKDDNIIIFWESAIKTKTASNKKNAFLLDSSGKENPLPKILQPLFNFLARQPYAQEFKLLSNIELAAWIKKEVETRGAMITNQAAQTLISLAGNDLWQINNEIDKLINYEAGQEAKLLTPSQVQKTKTISEEAIKQLVKGKFDENIFALTDALSNRNRKLASELLGQQYEAGLSDGYLLSMITRQFRILLQVRQALDSRFSSRKIITALKLHPFVAQKSINQVRNFNLASLKSALNKLVEIDYLVKTGQAEAQTLLNLFIQKI